MSLFFFLLQKSENRRVEQTLSWGLYQWEGGGYGERVKEGEYGANSVHTCIKMENETC
jgi:hypothetical protein